MLRFTFAALALTLAACSYTHHDPVEANGDSSQLYFFGATNNANEPLAVGYAATVTVQRYSAQDVECRGLGTHKNAIGGGGVAIQGGSLPDTDHCANRVADAVSLVSAACADDTCSVTADTTDPKLVKLTVTGAHAGQGRLMVSLKSGVDGNTYDDSISIRFEAPARIHVEGGHRDMAAITSPVLPGVEIEPLHAWIVDAKNERLDIAADALQASTEGDAYESIDGDYITLVAKRPGHTVLRWAYTGVPDRTVDLEVVDPADARALFVYAPDEKTSDESGDPAEAHVSAEPLSGRITSIDLVEYDFAAYPYRVKLADGRFALANIADRAMALTPSALGVAEWTLDRSAFDFEAKLAGHGMLTLTAAPWATLTLPVNVTARPKR